MTTREDVARLIEPLRGKKPILVYLDAKAVSAIRNPGVLSIDCTMFRNGPGTVSGVEARPFVELTPELLAWLREQNFESRK